MSHEQGFKSLYSDLAGNKRVLMVGGLGGQGESAAGRAPEGLSEEATKMEAQEGERTTLQELLAERAKAKGHQGGMAARIERRRERAGHITAGSRPATWRDFMVLLGLAAVAFVLGLVLLVYARVSAAYAGASRLDAECGGAAAVCRAAPLERPYVVGKACECLLGPALWEPLQVFAIEAPSTWGAAGMHQSLRRAVQEADSTAASTVLADGTAAGALDATACISLYGALEQHVHIKAVASRFRGLLGCGIHALKRLGKQETHGVVNDALHALVHRVASEFALRTPFHIEILCGIIDTPVIWERARTALQGTEAGQCTKAHPAGVCARESWRECPDATLSERKWSGRVQNESTVQTQDKLVSAMTKLLNERTGEAGIADRLTLMLDAGADKTRHVGHVRDYLLAGHSWRQVADKLLDKSILPSEEGPRMRIVGDDGTTYHPPVAGRPSAGACEVEGACLASAKQRVDEIFREVLLRGADEEGLKTYTSRLQADGDDAWLRRVLMDSPEFSSTCKGPTSCAEALALVEGLYLQVLGRAADPDGKMEYARRLALGRLSKEQVASALEQSHEFVTGPANVARKAVRSLLDLRQHFVECGGSEATIRGGRPGLVPRQNFSDTYWHGRWCDRRGCDDTGMEPCGYWPMVFYHMILASLWGNAPEHWLLRRERGNSIFAGDSGRVVGVQDGRLARFAAAMGGISGVYIEMLGRFPDTGAWVSRVPRFAQEILGRDAEGAEHGLLDELKRELLHSAERADKVATQTADERYWSAIAQRLADLHRRVDLAMPAPVAACFPGGQFAPAQGVECAALGKVIRMLQQNWNQNASQMGAKLSGAPVRAAHDAGHAKCLTPIALYVHQRPHYFRQVVEALKRVQRIGDVCVVVVSLDSVDPDMIEIAMGIDFAPVRMLFHPVRDDLVQLQPVVAIKQHWTWLQDEIWTRLPETMRHEGHVALLEEDHIVTPDYLMLLTELIHRQERECKGCWGVTVRWACMRDDDPDIRKLCRSHSVINTGIAFARSTYEAIKASDFESFSDGWDWSLFHLAQTGQMPDMMLGPAVSRITNIGRLGATVVEGGDAHLQRQLDYESVGHQGLQVAPGSLWIHTEEARQYTPPCWEPLFLGGVGFIA